MPRFRSSPCSAHITKKSPINAPAACVLLPLNMQIRIEMQPVFCTLRSSISSTAARVLLTSPSSQIVGNGISRAPQLALSAARVLLMFRNYALLQSRQCFRPTFTAHQLKTFKRICSAMHSNLDSSWQPVFCSLDPQSARVREYTSHI
jgi:hypothetical protein